MSEWSHSSSTSSTSATSPEPTTTTPVSVSEYDADLPPAEHHDNRKRKWGMLLAGSLGVFLVGGILFQIFRAEPGAAGPDDNGGQNTTAAGESRLSTVLARVDQHNITWREVAEECMARYGRDVLENIINRTIIQQACARRGITITKQEVLNEVRRIAKKFNLTPENWYQMLQAERGISPVQYHRDIIWPMLALKKIAGKKIKVNEEDMRLGFEKHYGPRVKAKMIMFENMRRAREVHNKLLQHPQDFERLAQRHSIEPNSRALGGDIPPIPRHSGNKKLEEAAFKLRPGEISPVVQIGFNRFVILKSEGRTEPKISNLDEVRHELYSQLLEEKTQQAVAQIFDKLKREARVDNFLTGSSTGIRQASGKKTDKTTGSARIRSNYPLPKRKPKKPGPIK